MQPETVLERPERAPDHLGAQARPAHPEQRALGEPVLLHFLGPCLEVGRLLEHRLADRQPAQPVGHLGRAGIAPQRVVLPPDALRDVVRLRVARLVGDRGLEVVRNRALDRGRAAGDDRLADLFDAVDQRVEGLHECLDPVGEELLRDVLHVDARVLECLQLGARVLIGGRAPDLGALAGGEQRGHRHRVHRVRGDELVHVLRVRVVRVLDARGRPQRPLHRAARVAQLREPVALEDLLEALVGGARIRDRGRALKLGVAGLLESLVDLGVHARDEEARDRVHVERLAGLEPALHRADEALGDLFVGLDREQQRDVDVDAAGQRLLDRVEALVGPRDLDHQVRAVHAAPEVLRLPQRAAGGIEREIRRDLERHEPVVAAGRVPHGAEHVGRELHVLDRDVLVDLLGRQPLARELLDVVVVVVRAEDRLLEDRGIRSDAAERVLLDQPLELPGLDRGCAGSGRARRWCRPRSGRRGAR